MRRMDTVDAVVVGAGVVGLATARALAMQGLEVVILEAEERYGSGVSSRNSEVIHAGIYYPFDSLKARLCVRGRELLYGYCRQRGVPHRRCGKLIVATRDDESPRLDAIERHARANGVNEKFVTGAALPVDGVPLAPPAMAPSTCLPATAVAEMTAVACQYIGFPAATVPEIFTTALPLI